MRGIFLTEFLDYIPKVYDKPSTEKLKNLIDIDNAVYTKADILKDSQKFLEVEFIFSTWGMPTFTEEEIKRYFPNLKCVFYGAGTVQKFARPFLNCNVKVFSAWSANAVPVAEYTASQIILSNKGFFRTSRLYKKGDIKKAREVMNLVKGNYSETVGIIGVGMIGKLVIKLLKNYNLNIIVYDPFLSDENAKILGVEKCELEELFSRAFVISNHLANNEQTKNMLKYNLFYKMRENAVFINTGRGAQVNEADLVKILKEREDLTALLDVTVEEPLNENHEFYSLENCVITPHIAGSLGNEVARMGEVITNEFELYKQNKPCLFEVNLKMLETMA